MYPEELFHSPQRYRQMFTVSLPRSRLGLGQSWEAATGGRGESSPISRSQVACTGGPESSLLAAQPCQDFLPKLWRWFQTLALGSNWLNYA
jgi:hypothetical protein